LRALVAGGSGFIGQHLVNALLKKGFQVRVLDLEAREPAQLRNERLELFIGDMLDEKAVDQTMKGIDVVYHLALADSFKDFNSLQINLEGTNNLLKAAPNFLVTIFSVSLANSRGSNGLKWSQKALILHSVSSTLLYHGYGLLVARESFELSPPR